MGKIEDLLPLCMPELPGCPRPSVLAALRLSVREFCVQSATWREWVELEIEPGEDSFQVSPQSSADVVMIKEITKDHRPISPGSDRAGLAVDASPTGGRRYAVVQPDTVKILFAPDEVETWHARLVLTTRSDADRYPDQLLGKEEALAAGAKFRLMRQPGKTWTDPAMAGFYERQFNRAAVAARIAADKENTTGTRTVRPRPIS